MLPPETPVTEERSTSRLAVLLAAATIGGQLAQLGWLAAGSRVMSSVEYGTVLAAQAVYALMQIVVDNGPAFYGARLAADGTLDRQTHSSILRLRLQLGAAASVLTLVLGGAAGTVSLEAASPFAGAVILFALFDYWRPFGAGDGRPFAAYVLLRSTGPALAAGVFLAADVRFPAYGAGLIECGVIVVVATAYGLRLIGGFRNALVAAPGPWRGSLKMGVPVVIAQVALASGTVLLNIASAATAASSLAVGVRLLTGVNGLSGVLAASLFPRLAKGRNKLIETAGSDRQRVSVALRVVLMLSAAAAGVVCLKAGPVVDLFLNRDDSGARATVILMVGSTGMAGYLLVVTMVLFARGHESVVLRAYAAGGGLTVALGVVVAVSSFSQPAVAMAVAFAIGEAVAVGLIRWSATALIAGLRTTLTAAGAGSYGLLGAAAVAAFAPTMRAPLAAVLAASGLCLLGATLFEWRGRLIDSNPNATDAT
jgi:O-antigen/teichoic acid export membrane protein